MINQLTHIQLPNQRILGRGHPTYIIAEIGSNHDGDLERAKMLIQQAKEAGADAVKFQSFHVENILNPDWRAYGGWEPDPAWGILSRLSIPYEWHVELNQEAERVGIDFLSTPFDLERLQWLIDLNVPAIKIASGDLTYHELLRAAGKSDRPVFLATGHATLSEVEEGLKVLWETGCKDIVLMHCVSSYPAKTEESNIRAMYTMMQGFQMQVGYSDHTPESTIPIAAVTLGACVIEKHLTDDPAREGPDHSFALSIEQFTDMVKQIRLLESALVGGAKFPRESEMNERIMARRGIYAKCKISKGEKISREMLKVVRHHYPEGVGANHLDNVMGKTAKVEIEPNQMISWEMI